MRRLLACFILFAFVGAGGALAARGDPQKRINPADQARAKAMLLRKADLGPGFQATPPASDDDDLYCKALDESDLTLTAEVESPDFRRLTQDSVTIVSSLAQIYETVGQANASWERGTSAAGVSCIRQITAATLRKEGVRLSSFKAIAIPRLAQRSVAFRAVAVQQGVRLYVDLVALKHGRAQVGMAFASALAPTRRAEELALGRIVAGRMATAMRGG
jgi:hypothetical protein